ncbi:MAG TPA: DUF2207 domain-containing protein [Gemmatimonadales bacterium]|nr:DUF2207 domain-containing protein [Gemmatimonadales bacterium]
MLLLLAAAAAPAAAQRSFVIERFDATIRVERSGELDITETISPRFSGSWNGIIRSIPVQYRTPQGFNWTLGVSLVGVTDPSGQALRTETTRERHYIKYKIWIPGAQDATRTIVLHYRAGNGLRFFDDHDELYWNVTGDEWDVAIESASATIELPAGAQGVRAIAFNGVYGSVARDAQVAIAGASIRITLPHQLEFHEGLTAVVGWNKGLVAEPTAVQRVGGFLRTNWPLLVPLLVFLVAFLSWRRRGRDPRLRPIAVQYDPPEGLTPAEAGTLIDESADLRDITATMVDLAVRGYLKFEERDERHLHGLIGKLEYVLHRLKPPAEWSALKGHERKVLEGLFEDAADSVKLSDLQNEFYRQIPGINSDLFGQLVQRGFYRTRPDSVRARWMGCGMFLGICFAVLGGMVAAKFSLTPVPFVIAGILSAAILLFFGRIMPARTEAGARALEGVLGFEEFLTRVEKEHYERIAKRPELFERYLPFAMALGVEKKWAKAFEGIYTTPPAWYVGSPGGFTSFNASQFSSRLADFSGKAGSTMASSPRSSSGSGFGGGGSSGGGGGGGGGSGF